MRVLATLVVIFWAAVAGQAQTAASPEAQARALGAAMAHIRAEDWRRSAIAAEPAGEIGRDIVDWHRLRRGGAATFAEYQSFVQRRSDWPGLEWLKRRGEAAIPPGARPEDVLAWFDGATPTTGTGVLRLTAAHRALGHSGDAEALAVLAWRTLEMSAEIESALLETYRPLLADHHEARLDELLWQGKREAARRMFPRVSEDWQKLAEARMALAQQAPGVDVRIDAVPERLAGHPGLAYERFNWRVKKGRSGDAIALMRAVSTTPEALGRPDNWANWRRIYARRLMRDGKPEEAYALASLHFLVEGSSFADLEWLSGFLALRFLGDPELALFHFERFEAAVETPISLGRAGYWQGRAYADLGDADAAQAAYARGAEHQTSFYGLLAAEAGGIPLDPDLPGAESFPPIAETAISGNSVLTAGLLFLKAGEDALAERFFTHLVETADRPSAGALGNLMLEAGEEHIALMIAKRGARYGKVLNAAYFPMSPLMERELPVDKDLALAIARRESEFDPVVVSPAGARGLMQLMPGTASDVSAELGIPYDRDGLTRRPDYNVRLGSAYLAGLIEVFGPGPVLVSVGYNAGPGRSIDWVADRGDPRSAGVDLVDWIEMIPFRETRNYVMRVTESVINYRARLSGETGPVRFLDYLRNG